MLIYEDNYTIIGSDKKFDYVRRLTATNKEKKIMEMDVHYLFCEMFEEKKEKEKKSSAYEIKIYKNDNYIDPEADYVMRGVVYKVDQTSGDVYVSHHGLLMMIPGINLKEDDEVITILTLL